jgi:hypothetical protein
LIAELAAWLNTESAVGPKYPQHPLVSHNRGLDMRLTPPY